MYALQANMREAECARSNLAEDLSRLRMELEKVASLKLVLSLSWMLCYVMLLLLGVKAASSWNPLLSWSEP